MADDKALHAPFRVEPPAPPAPPTVRVAAVPTSIPLARHVPVPQMRLFEPDLTGWWEAAGSKENEHPPLMAQLNQAGSGLSVWFTRPPPGLEGVNASRIKDSSGTPRAWTYGVGTAVLCDKTGLLLLTTRNGAQLSWVACEPGPDLFNRLDPSLASGRIPLPTAGTFEGNGTLTLTSREPTALALSFSSDGAAPFRLTRVRRGARWPGSVLNRLVEPLRGQSLIDHARPIPSTLQRQLLGLFSPEANDLDEPKLAPLLRAWHSRSGQEKAGRRLAIAQLLEFGLDEPWRARMLDLMALSGTSNTLPIDGATKTYYGWLAEVLADEVANGDKAGRRAESRRIQDAIRQLGIAKDAMYAYALTFSEIGGERPTVGVNVAGYVFGVTVSKSRVTLKRDAKGAPTYTAGGRAEVERRDPLPWDADVRLAGVFGRLDAGVAFKAGRAGIKVNPGGSGVHVPDPEKSLKDAYIDAVGSANLGTVEFLTPLDLHRNTDFSWAWFSIASAVLLKGRMGNWLSANAVDSSLWSLRLYDHPTTLTAVVDADRVEAPKVSNWGSIGSRKWWNDWVPKDFDLDVGRLALGVGGIVPLGSPGRAAASPKQPVQIVDAHQPLNASAPVLFDYQGYDLDTARPEQLLTGRMRLELTISELRGLLAVPGPDPVLYATTSPEGTELFNDSLAVNRGLAVAQAIVDCLGPVLARESVGVFPLGERPSRARGDYPTPPGDVLVGGTLPDPESYPSRAAFFSSPDGGTAGQWPAWRRVDLVIEGTLAIRYTVRDAPPGG
jgi:hypothetical protein